MKRVLITIIISTGILNLIAQPVHVGLYQDHLIHAAVVYCSAGNYQLWMDGEMISRVDEGDILYLTQEENRIKLLDGSQDYGHCSGLELKALSTEAVFRVRPIDPELESRIYDDDLVVSAADRFMTLVNRLDFDKYLAGVVEAEAGANAEKEFYKAQSILCRTYAMKYTDRHQSEGFSLCDGTHCQAYKGKSVYNPEILESIQETSGLILADYNFKLITAAYHSNSGGQTQRAADVWLTDLDYLQSVVDPYSLCTRAMPNGGIPFHSVTGKIICLIME